MAKEHSAKLITHYLVTGGFVMYHRALAHAVGDHSAGLLLSQFWGWSGTEAAKARGGWFYKTQAEITQETAMTRREQETARRKLRELGLIEEQMRGQPAKLWFRLDLDAIMDLLQTKAEEVSEGGNSQDGGKRQPSMAESANLEWPNAPTKDGGKRQAMHGGNRQPTKKQATKQTTTAGKSSKPIQPEKSAAAVSNASLFDEVTELLTGVGFDADAASQIAQHPNATAENVRRQIEAMRKRKATTNWHGLLRRAIESSFVVPVDAAEKEQTERRRKEQERAEREAALRATQEAQEQRKTAGLRVTLDNLKKTQPQAFSEFQTFIEEQRQKELNRPLARDSEHFRKSIERSYQEEGKTLDLLEIFLAKRGASTATEGGSYA